jgi:WD40 repeat protein
MEIEDEKINEDQTSSHAIYLHLEEKITIEEDIGFDDENIKQRIHALKFNHNDQYLAAAYKDGKIRVFNVMTKHLTCTLNCNPSTTETLVQSIQWRPKIEGRTNNILMAICRDRMVEYHTPSRKIVNSITFPDNTIYSCEYSHDGMYYALGLKDYSIRVFDGLTKKEVVKLGGIDNQKITGHQSKIFALKFVKDQKVLISGGWDDTLIFWDLNSKIFTCLL